MSRCRFLFIVILFCKCGGSMNGAIHAIGKEQAGGSVGRSINNVQHLSRRATEDQAVGVRWHDVGCVIEDDARIVRPGIDGAVQRGAQSGNLARDRLRGGARLIEEGADGRGVIGLRAQNARGGRQNIPVGDQGRAAMIGRHSHVFKNISAHQKVGVEKGSKDVPAGTTPAAWAAVVKLLSKSMAGMATGCTPAPISAVRRNLTWLSSSAAISCAYCCTAMLTNGTAALFLTVTVPCVPEPVMATPWAWMLFPVVA